MHLTIAEAMHQTAAREDALLGYLRRNKIRGIETPDGWLIDATSLFKMFPLASGVAEAAPVLKIVLERGEPCHVITRLQELLELERQRSAELRQERDRWAAQATRLVELSGPQQQCRPVQ